MKRGGEGECRREQRARDTGGGWEEQRDSRGKRRVVPEDQSPPA